MTWDDFRKQYSELHLSSLREKSRIDAESRLTVAARILRPKTLEDVASTAALQRLQLALLEGRERRLTSKNRPLDKRPRSAHTVRTYMAVIVAALRWAEYMGFIDQAPRFRRVKTAQLRHMKGRPLTEAEVQQLLSACEAVVGEQAAPSFKTFIRAAVASGLRLGELMNVHWTDRRYIVPTWPDGQLPVLSIPASMQKNATEESIPLLPWFENLLLETPAAARSGFVFKPESLQLRINRAPRFDRHNAEWVGKVLCRIGREANVIVQPASPDRPAKYASAHDLRRTCADRLIAAGVPEREVARIMRHASVETTRRYYAPGRVQQSAEIIRRCLATQEAVAAASSAFDEAEFAFL